MIPMLAFNSRDKKKHLKFPCYVQPKLNGFRCLASNEYMKSREQHIWAANRLKHIRSDLENLRAMTGTSVVFDGELYKHGLSLQEIASRAAVKRIEPHPKESDLEYHIFDFFDRARTDLTFEQRSEIMDNWEDCYQFKMNCIRMVNTHYVESMLDSDPIYTYYKNRGYEGIMYRYADASYGRPENCTNKENRWNCLLKRKDKQDEEFDVIGFEFGNGKYSNTVGALTFQLPNGATFSAGSGLSDLQREEILRQLPLKATVKFEAYSDGGIPTQPTIELLHYE